MDRLIKEIPTAKLITPSVIVDRLRVNGSLARRAVLHLEEKGLIKCISRHRSQWIYTRATAAQASETPAEAVAEAPVEAVAAE